MNQLEPIKIAKGRIKLFDDETVFAISNAVYRLRFGDEDLNRMKEKWKTEEDINANARCMDVLTRAYLQAILKDEANDPA